MRKFSFKALCNNILLALMFAGIISYLFGISPYLVAAVIVGVNALAQYKFPKLYQAKLLDGLQTELWVPGIKENPVPDTSFVSASVDMSEYVEHNKLHLAEAGIEPDVHEDYFLNNENPLPLANIQDTPNEVVLKTYSTDQTRHRQLQEVELQYNRRESLIARHRNSLAKNIGARAAFSWTTDQNDEFNKLAILGAEDSIIDALIEAEAFFASLDKYDNLNACLPPEHMARLRKEDYKLYKDMMANPGEIYFGFKIWRYSKTPLFTDLDAKKPFGAVAEPGDKRSTFLWASDEVFRCFGDTEMYATLRDSGLQADTLSFAQRALVGKIRAANPKYLATII